MLKLKMLQQCSNCKMEYDVPNLLNLDGWCSYCNEHRGNIMYFCDMSVEDFILELSKASEGEIAKYAQAIKICADDLYNKT